MAYTDRKMRQRSRQSPKRVGWRSKKPSFHKYGPNTSKTYLGTVETEEGYSANVVVEVNKWSERAGMGKGRIERRVLLEPTREARETKAYRDRKREMGDDFVTDITNTWANPGKLSPTMQKAISNELGY